MSLHLKHGIEMVFLTVVFFFITHLPHIYQTTFYPAYLLFLLMFVKLMALCVLGTIVDIMVNVRYYIQLYFITQKPKTER